MNIRFKEEKTNEFRINTFTGVPVLQQKILNIDTFENKVTTTWEDVPTVNEEPIFKIEILEMWTYD